MKRRLLLCLLCMLGLFCLTGCGDKTLSKEEMLENAKDLDITELRQKVIENKANAEKTYIGNNYKITGYIVEIESDYVAIDNGDYQARVKVYMEKESIAELERNYQITVVGKIDKFVNEDLGNMIQDSYTIMNNAYYIGNEYEVTGFVEFCGSNEQGTYCKTKDNLYIYLEKDIATKYDKNNTPITAKGNLYHVNMYNAPYQMLNAKVIE